MNASTADIVICGAGMAGVSAAYHLVVKNGAKNIVLIDDRAPLTLTSDKGTQAYRNWWPGPDATMVRFISRSIDLMEEIADECGNLFRLNRRGYVFLTADRDRMSAMKQQAEAVSALGAGPVRIHPGDQEYSAPSAEGFHGQITGVDLVFEPGAIRNQFPFITKDVVGMMHARRCGWLDSVGLGGYLLEQAQNRGLSLIRDRVTSVRTAGGRVQTIDLASGGRIDAGRLLIAAGPLLKQAGNMLGVDFPVVNELHGKVRFKDYLGIVPSSVPMIIWNDPVYLDWTESERKELASRVETRFLLDEFPAGVHFRPCGQGETAELLIIWTYDARSQDEPVWPPVFPPHYARICLRGLSRMIPALTAYFGKEDEGQVDGGYYCKTRDNRPLIGPLSVEGAYVIAALSGYGIMASLAAGELVSAHVMGAELPDYASAFSFERFSDPSYREVLDALDATSGQL